jgi:hypothetical protein
MSLTWEYGNVRSITEKGFSSVSHRLRRLSHYVYRDSNSPDPSVYFRRVFWGNASHWGKWATWAVGAMISRGLAYYEGRGEGKFYGGKACEQMAGAPPPENERPATAGGGAVDRG